MIVIFNKKTGEIKGLTTERVVFDVHLGFFIDSKNNDRLIIDWKPIKYYDKNRDIIPNDCIDALDENGNLIVVAADFNPNHPQKELFIELDKNPSRIYEYKVDIKTKKLVKI